MLVSNVGAAKSKGSEVRVYNEAGILLAKKKAKGLAAPTDFVEKSTELTFDGLNANGPLTIVVNEDGDMKELNRYNNRALVK